MPVVTGGLIGGGEEEAVVCLVCLMFERDEKWEVEFENWKTHATRCLKSR